MPSNQKSNIEFIESSLKKELKKSAIIDKEVFIADISLNLGVDDRSIKKAIKNLELTKRIDVRIWK